MSCAGEARSSDGMVVLKLCRVFAPLAVTGLHALIP